MSISASLSPEEFSRSVALINSLKDAGKILSVLSVADVFPWPHVFDVVVAQTDHRRANNEWQFVEAILVTSMQVDHFAIQAISYGIFEDRIAAKSALPKTVDLEELKDLVVLGEHIFDVSSNN